MVSTKHGLVGFGLLTSIIMVAFLIHSKNVNIQIAQKEQLVRAELVMKKLDRFADTSDLLGRFIQEDLKGHQYSKVQVESNLQQYLRASPADVIFGVGIWYAPFSFSKRQRLFGPYVHRPEANLKSSNAVLTYEWNTEAYNYPSQDWYLKGRDNPVEGAFVDPYFDSGLVYVTNARAFFGPKNEVLGVISVDMVISQLQDIVLQSYQPNKEHTIILNRSNKLLAHPLKEKFFELKEIVDGKDNQSLLNFTVSDLNLALNEHNEDWIQSELTQSQLGWKIVVMSSKSSIAEKSRQLRDSILGALAILWILIGFTLQAISARAKDKKESEAKLDAGRIQLIQSARMAALGEMAAGIAHEINSPLAVIVGKTHQIERHLKGLDFDSTELVNKLNVVSSTAERISRIINGLRTFARSGEGDAFQPALLAEIINDTVALCAERFKKHGILFEISPIPHVILNCRPTQISQVFLNILSNSFDAVENLPVRWVRLEFKIDVESRVVHIEFIDSGKGIPPEVVKRMIQPFFTTKEVGKGTGLGLSISSGILGDHSGKLAYDESSPNTKFVVTLPIAAKTRA